MNARPYTRWAVLVLPVLLSACSIYSLPGANEAPVPPVEAELPPEAVARPDRPESAATPREQAPAGAVAAYQPLLERAAQARTRGDYEQSLALLERAQRIDPDSAAVYLAMAETHAQRGDDSQARATAERGLLYCDNAQQCAALRGYLR